MGSNEGGVGKIMKQHITVEQLNELSEKGKEKLRKWWKPIVGDWFDDDGYMRIIPDDETKGAFVLNSFHTPLLSIGQMIEFLDEHLKTDWSICSGKNLLFFGRSDRNEIYGKIPQNRKGELCDALWKAVKEVLENK